MKATKAELEHRITIVLDLIARRFTRKRIISHIKEEHKDWNVKPGMIDIYCAKAREIMYEKMDRQRDEILAEAINDLERLYTEAIKNDDLAEARRIIIDKTKLYEVYKGTSDKLKPVMNEVKPITDKVQTIMEKIQTEADTFTAEITYNPQSELHKKTMKLNQPTLIPDETTIPTQSEADTIPPIDEQPVNNNDSCVDNSDKREHSTIQSSKDLW